MILLLTLIVLIPLGQFGRIPIGMSGAQEIPLMLNDVLIPVFLAVWLMRKLLRKEQIVIPRFFFAVILFSLIGVFSLLWSGFLFPLKTVVVASLYLIRWVEVAGVFLLTTDSVRTKKDVQKILVAFALGGGVLALLGLIQYKLVPDFAFLVQYGWDPHLERVASTFLDPNYAGIFFVITISVIFALWYMHPTPTSTDRRAILRSFAYRMLLLAMGGAVLLALVLSYSRSALLALVIVGGVFGLMRDRRLLVVGMVGLVMMVLFFPRIQERFLESFDYETSAYKRLDSWNNALTILDQTNPIVGIGFNTYRQTQIELDLIREEELMRSGAGTDSSLLLILVTTGVAGLLFYVFFLIHGTAMGFRLFQQLPHDSQGLFGLSFAASLLALLLHSQFVNSLLYPFILIYFWIGMGIVSRKVESQKSKVNEGMEDKS